MTSDGKLFQSWLELKPDFIRRLFVRVVCTLLLALVQ